MMGEVATVAAALIALAALIVSVVQWLLSQEASRRQQRADEAARLTDQAAQHRLEQAGARDEALRRDSDLTTWGTQVLALMAEIEAQCWPLVSDTTLDAAYVEKLSWRASALVDAGRLFFPRVDVPTSTKGYRVRLLDEVLRACYVARHVAAHGRHDGELLRLQVWRARGRFVELLQAQVRMTMRPVGLADAGERVDPDPRRWPRP